MVETIETANGVATSVVGPLANNPLETDMQVKANITIFLLSMV